MGNPEQRIVDEIDALVWPALFPAMKRRGKGRQRGRRFVEWDADRQPVAWGSIQGGRRA